MKLRRTLATAATTAVLAPLALLSAPAAFAEEPSTPSETPSASAPEAPPESTPETTPESTPPTTTSEPEATPSTSAPATEEEEEEGGETDPTESQTPTTTPSQSSEPEDPSDPEIPFCEELDEDYGDAKVSAQVKGLPGKIVAGSGAHSFQLVVTNDSSVDINGVAFYAEIENYELDEDKFLSPYIDLEFKNPEDGKWTRIGNDEWAGDYFAYVDELKAKASQKFDLRVSIDAKAPAGDAWSFGSGAYLDKVDDQDCIAEGWAQYDFEVLKAGSENPNPGEAGPSDPGDKGKGEKDSVKKPQGDVSELPKGNLAETGSSSALPVIGLVGGIAVVAGAGAVFLVRRRKGADAVA
ncbi:LAETG motif-containing sortase-dependent surface protein [Streptomyces acidicola]|uniref:LAETG motif-containing sortase-dependent surface protein n=1 Tax=Streptomyces acidicola TaxID=2596892 RepID=UPI0037B8BCE0